MRSRNEYLRVLKRRDIGATKREKGQILDEYCENTGQNRKYVIRKIRAPIALQGRYKRRRRQRYGSDVIVTLAKLWAIFDYPCGQRLAPLLQDQELIARLRAFGELTLSDEIACRLPAISPATIDRRLRHEKEVLPLRHRRRFGAVGGRGHDSAFINNHLFEYCQREEIRFSRSRPYHKNDNCYVEQKNWTHIKKVFGYLRYDTEAELEIINALYENQLRLYKNFFQPVMKLKTKTRLGGKLQRKYDVPSTPYQRLIGSEQIERSDRRKLETLYRTLNPAQLKREIDQQLQRLYKLYHKKQKAHSVRPFKKQSPRTSVTL